MKGYLKSMSVASFLLCFILLIFFNVVEAADNKNTAIPKAAHYFGRANGEYEYNPIASPLLTLNITSSSFKVCGPPVGEFGMEIEINNNTMLWHMDNETKTWQKIKGQPGTIYGVWVVNDSNETMFSTFKQNGACSFIGTCIDAPDVD